jgi:effector-binding domain-containing protein
MRLAMRQMRAAPQIVTRDQQPYVAIRQRVTMSELAGLAACFAELFAWLESRRMTPAGPPFFRYIIIDMNQELEVDVGVLVATAVDGDGRVVPRMLPAGRYATLFHVGPPSELANATSTLLDWGAGLGLTWDMSQRDGAECWGSRLEIYLTDPTREPDMSKWETHLAFRLAD